MGKGMRGVDLFRVKGRGSVAKVSLVLVGKERGEEKGEVKGVEGENDVEKG